MQPSLSNSIATRNSSSDKFLSFGIDLFASRQIHRVFPKLVNLFRLISDPVMFIEAKSPLSLFAVHSFYITIVKFFSTKNLNSISTFTAVKARDVVTILPLPPIPAVWL